MEPHHETGFPATLCRWVGEIVQSSPEAARLTLLELIVGALLASGGHVTQALLALTPRLGGQAYHWMLERGRFRLLGLIAALCRIVRREIGERRCFVVIDDTLAPRGLAQAPGVAVRFDHAAKTNRPTFLLCQGFVTLSAVVPCQDRSVPLVTGLCRSSGTAGKLAIAKGLLRAVGALVPAARRLVHARLADPHCPAPRPRGHRPGDTALFALPPPRQPGRRGRSRLYGARLDADTVAALPASAIAGYGGPGCAMPCVARASSRVSSSVVRVGEGLRLDQSAPAAVHRSDAVRPGHRRGIFQEVSPCSAILRWSMAWGPCGSAGALLCCAGSTSFRSPAPLLTARAEPHALIRLGGWRPAATLTLVKDAFAACFRNFEAFRLLPETCRKSGPVRSTGKRRGCLN